MVTRIVSFDFDGTLINTPGPELGRPIWEQKKGQILKGKGWWGIHESLDPEIFDFPKIDWVYDEFVEACKDPDTFVFIATGRLKRLQESVLKVLDIHGIQKRSKPESLGFDALYCNPGTETFLFKSKLFEEIIKQHPKATEFQMYDDRQAHLPKFADWAKNQQIHVSIIDVLNRTEII